MTIKSRETIAAEEAARLRKMMPASTDPAWLERQAKHTENAAARSGLRYLCKMPDDGPWEIRRTAWGIVAASREHGLYLLKLSADGTDLNGAWVKIAICSDSP